MHDVTPVVWSEAVYQDALRTFEDQGKMSHSDSFSLAAPAGPAGENLYQAMEKPTVKDTVAAWYVENEDCGRFPGCKSGATGVTGHFTAMIWNGAQEIGCTTNKHNLVACRYKGSDTPTCRTPNMGGEFKSNVFGRARTLQECTALVDQCGIGSGGCGNGVPAAPLPPPAPPSKKPPAPDNCGKSQGGWSCPAGGGCPAAGACTGDWQAFVDAHNIYRCMHDVKPVVWSEAVYQDALRTFRDQPTPSHSDSFSLLAPAGPAGENLYKSSWRPVAEDVVATWYAEVEDCGAFPGCKSGSIGVTGHFTVLVWNGAQEIGCATNEHNLVACRYKGGDTPSCRTPNMHGHFATNVFKPVRTLAKCQSMVQKCKTQPRRKTKRRETEAVAEMPEQSERQQRLDQVESDARQSIQYLDGEIKSVKEDGIKSIQHLQKTVENVEEAGKSSIQYMQKKLHEDVEELRGTDQQIESDARKSIQYLHGEMKSVKEDGIKSITYLDEKVDGVEEAGKRSIQYLEGSINGVKADGMQSVQHLESELQALEAKDEVQAEQTANVVNQSVQELERELGATRAQLQALQEKMGAMGPKPHAWKVPSHAAAAAICLWLGVAM
jgi:uncharacterized coiled-coil protein SlyX